MLADNIQSRLPIRKGDRKVWGNLLGSAQALAISEAIKYQEDFCIVVTDNSQTALSLEHQLAFYSPDTPILHFPDWETLPYDHFSPHQDIISERIDCLYQLMNDPKGVLFVPINTLLQRLCPADYIQQHHFRLRIGDHLALDAFKQRLQKTNYQRVSTVLEHGEYAIRGGIIDLFPMGSDAPFRLELFDNEIENIKRFDTETQRTIANIEAIEILPAKEFPLDKPGYETFRDNWYEHFDTHIKDTAFHQDLEAHIGFSGIEYYLPLFFQETVSLLDYIQSDCLLITTEHIETSCRQFWKDINQRYEQYAIDRTRPLLKPKALFFSEQDIHQAFKSYPRISLSSQSIDDANKGFYLFQTQPDTDLAIEQHNPAPYNKLQDYLQRLDKPLLFCAESVGRKEVFYDIFRSISLDYKEVTGWQNFLDSGAPVGLTVSSIDQGLNIDTLAVIVESQLFGYRVQQRRRRKKTEDNSDAIIKSLTELKLGAAVVHLNHGIGRYLGLKVIETDGQKNEYLNLQYANNASLYVPVASLHLISRYSGAENQDQVPLHKLGNDSWQKAKRKAAEKANDVAAELLDIYARRAARTGFAYEASTDEYKQFAESFAFEETDDQDNAITAVLKDMSKPTPMDRLICGDVGFGKTEVAMRAAFIAAQNNKQVAILVPTTLLAQQHYESLQDRFADYAITIDVLSRFKTSKQQQTIIEQLHQGKIDILIGTHKLLQGTIKFNRLGLIIIDEEHRFGVKQKEILKTLRAEVDVLAMTATPIPRTLNLSMAGIRDISIIATPPAKRLSIKTFVHSKDDALIKEAILRELLRGGQVFYLYNEVKTIENMAKELSELIPEARIGIGHGQMRESELEGVMSDFYHKRFNVLLCTTIIETGIDIPSANTIIIDRADKFGLAQLHQLRGRVGRSHHQAYAYLLTPKDKKLTKDAEKRLDAIQEATDLGAGFTLATHDLEIRGAGELLGDEQTGHIQTVGYTLYMDMLDKAVKSIQRGETPNIEEPLNQGTEVDLSLSAIIPDDYLPDVHTRLIMYKKIANSQSKAALRDLKIEMIDRFGLLPDPVNHLFDVTEIKLLAEKLGIIKVYANASNGKIQFSQRTTVDPIHIVQMIQKNPQAFQLDGADSLKFTHNSESPEQRIATINAILSKFP